MRIQVRELLCILFLMVGISLLSYAQEGNTLDTIARKLRYFAVDNPMWTSQLIEPRYSQIRLQYDQEGGDYRMAQQADRTRQFAFRSEGSITLKEARLWGSFAYRNAREDSTRFGHQTRQNPEAPFYFASYGANHYERADYSIKVRGQRYFYDKRWSVFAGLDYVLGDHFSNNDPRGSINVFQLGGKLGVDYQLSEAARIGLQRSYGYGEETFEIAFKNGNYAEQSVVSPYLNYSVFGYGWRVQDWLIDKGMNYQMNTRRPGLRGFLSHQKSDQSYYVYVGYQDESQRYQQVLRNESRRNELTAYKSQALDYGVQWHKKGEQRQFYFYMQGQHKRGKDKLPEGPWAGVNNYVYIMDNVEVHGAYSRRHDRWQYDYEGRLTYLQEKRSDGGSGTVLDYSQIAPQLSLMLTRILHAEQHIQFGLKAFAYVRPSVTWNLPQVNENAFHRYVFYHDVNYLKQNSYGGELQLGYRKLLQKNSFLHLGVRYQRMTTSDFDPQQGIVNLDQSNQRNQLKIALTYGF